MKLLNDEYRNFLLDIKEYVKKRRKNHKKIGYGLIGEYIECEYGEDLAKMIVAMLDKLYVKPPAKRNPLNNLEEFARGNAVY